MYSCVLPWYHIANPITNLLVITKEDLDRQPRVTANLEALRQRVDDLDLIIGQLPAVKLEVGLDTLSGDRLRDDAGTALQTPDKQNLLDCLALLVGKLLEFLVLVERRVSRAQTGVGGGVNALLLKVAKELRSVILLMP